MPNLPADTLPILTLRTTPCKTRVIHLPVGRPTSTAVARWRDPADVARCTDCRHCTADPDGFCLVGVNRIVSEEEARTLTDRDCDWYRMPPSGGIRALSS